MHNKQHFLIDGLNLQYGGGVVVMKRLAKAFVASGHQVTILLARELSLDDITDNAISVHFCLKAEGPFLTMLYRYKQLEQFCCRIGATAILSFNYFTPSRLPQVTYHINVIPFLPFTKRRQMVGLARAILQHYYSCLALRRSGLNLFESIHVRELAESTGCRIQNPDVAYIGIDIPLDLGNETKIPKCGPIVTITSGGVHKRNDLTISAFRQYWDRNPEAQLVIVGNADAILSSLPTPERVFSEECPAVRYTGYLERQELYSVLADATVLLTFSELESFYMVAVEAMAVGCPVIAPDISSIRESVGDAGLLFRPGDVDAAVHYLVHLEQADDWYVHSKASRQWAEKFDADRCAAIFVQTCMHGLFP
jgi:glycosyltransferase involved in cell wall biosynthesis